MRFPFFNRRKSLPGASESEKQGTDGTSLGFDPSVIRDTFSRALTRGDFGQLFHHTLFERAPEFRPFFADTDPATQNQAFVRGLSYIVKSLDEPDRLWGYLRRLGARHAEYGARPEHYAEVGDALLGALARSLGNQWNEQAQQHWAALLSLVVETMKRGAESESRHAA